LNYAEFASGNNSPDHACYIAKWLQVLKNDTRAIFQAAAFAHRAVDYLHSFQPEQTDAAA
jgi:antirestriction protein ArdC